MAIQPCPKCREWWKQDRPHSYHPFDYWLADGILIHFEDDTADFADPSQQPTETALAVLEVARGLAPLVNETYESGGKAFFELDITAAIKGHYEYLGDAYHLLYSCIFEAQSSSNIKDDWPEGIRYKQERRVRSGYIYVLKSNQTDLYKIGLSHQPSIRIKTLCRLERESLQTVALFHTLGMPIIEKELHALFASKRVRGEWFSLDQEDIEYIKSLQGGENVTR